MPATQLDECQSEVPELRGIPMVTLAGHEHPTRSFTFGPCPVIPRRNGHMCENPGE